MTHVFLLLNKVVMLLLLLLMLLLLTSVTVALIILYRPVRLGSKWILLLNLHHDVTLRVVFAWESILS